MHFFGAVPMRYAKEVALGKPDCVDDSPMLWLPAASSIRPVSGERHRRAVAAAELRLAR